VKFLVDMNLSPRWAILLTAEGLHAIHWSSIGRSDTPDDEILAYARVNDYVILTKDLDFGTMLATLQDGKPSVVQLRMEVLRPEPLIDRVSGLLLQVANDLEEGAIFTISKDRARLRKLPFG